MPSTEVLRVLRHSLRQMRRAAFGWTIVSVLAAAGVISAYQTAYPTQAGRRALQALIGQNVAFQAVNGIARNLDTVGGFATWRIGGSLALLAGIWGLLAMSRMLRGEEEAGRWEFILAGAVSVRGAMLATLAAFALLQVVLWAALTLAYTSLGLPASTSSYLALTAASAGLVFGALGALCSQLASTRRGAAAAAGILLGVSFLLRVVANGTRTLGWMRWLSPLGWAEEMRPFSGSRVLPLVLLLLLITLLAFSAAVVAGRRDLGTGAIAFADRSRGATDGPGTPLGLAVLGSRGTIVAWTSALGVFAVIFGLLAKDIAGFAAISEGFQRFAGQIGGSLVSAEGFLGFAFVFLGLPVAFFAATRSSAMWDEETTGRLENLLVRPVDRRRWICSEALVAVLGFLLIAFVVGGLAWASSAAQHAGVGLPALMGGALNTLPVAALFFGLGTALFGFLPRATAGLTMGAVVATYFLNLIGSLARLPGWLLDLSPFHHVAVVPGTPADVTSAFVMCALGALLFLAGMERFVRRDVASA